MVSNRRSLLKGVAGLTAAASAYRINYARAQSGPIRIGVMYALSGVGAPTGTQLSIGARIAAVQINRAGGLLGREVELVIRDDKLNSAAAVAAGRELVGDGINLLVGGAQTVSALGLISIAPELKAVIVTTAAGMSVTHELFSRYVFRATANTYSQFASMGRAMVEREPAVKTWIALCPDGEFGRDSQLFFGSAAKKFGKDVKMLDPVFIAAGTTDFKPQINAIMNSSAEGLFMSVLGADQISFLQQARQVGLYDKYKVICEAGNEVITAKALKQNTPPNFRSITFWNPDMEPFASNPMSKQLYEDYVTITKGDKSPAALMMLGNRSTLSLLEGIRRAKSTESDAVIAAMEGMTIDTAGGPFHYRKEDHQSIAINYFSRIEPTRTDPFFKMTEIIGIDGRDTTEPPTPGVKFDPPKL